jgi:tRNA 5-methylaminomethyl-2-thiouridine biosynthesis bifunctional protein
MTNRALNRRPDDAMAYAANTLLAGCALPAAWQGAESWTVLDLNFCAGAALLATLRAWHDDPRRPARLHYAVLTGAAVSRQTLRERFDRYGIDQAAAGCSGESGRRVQRDLDRLLEQWPIALKGVSRIELASARIQLTLAAGPPATLLPGLVPRIDSLYLPYAEGAQDHLTSPMLRAALARLAPDRRAALAGIDRSTEIPGSILASLADAGMQPELIEAGGRVAFRLDRRHGRSFAQPAPQNDRHALVIGSGLAGCATAFALARRGWSVERLDQGDHALDGASGQASLAHHPSITPDDAPFSQLTRAALQLSRSHYDVRAVSWSGRLQLCTPDEAESACDGIPADWAEPVDVAQASVRAAMGLRSGGIWIPGAGHADPAVLAAGWAISGIQTRYQTRVSRLERKDGRWQALDPDGHCLAQAEQVVIAAGAQTGGLLICGDRSASVFTLADAFDAACLQQRPGRSLCVTLPHGAMPSCVVGGNGHAIPIDGQNLLLGPADPADPLADAAGQASAATTIWHRFRESLQTPVTPLSMRFHPAGVRLSTRDHLPLAGPVPDVAQIVQQRNSLIRHDRMPLPAMQGLWVAAGFGGRGLLWSVLAADLIAARLDAAPAPLQHSLAQALDPGRFIRRNLRRDRNIV